MQTLITMHALIKHKNKYLILQRADDRSNPGYWNCVTGHVKEKESVEETAIREVKEETNLDGVIIKTVDPFVHMQNEKRWIIFPYLVEVENISNIKIDDRESKDFKWIEIDDPIISQYKGIEDTFKSLELI